jgi:methyl-accepting chemotaxis protein
VAVDIVAPHRPDAARVSLPRAILPFSCSRSTRADTLVAREMVQSLFQSRAFYTALVAVALAVGAGAWMGGNDQGSLIAALIAGGVGLIALVAVVANLPAPRGSSLPASALREVGDGKKPRRPAEITPQEAELYDALDEIAEQISDSEGEEDELREDAERASRDLEAARRDLEALRRDHDSTRSRVEGETKSAQDKIRELEEKLRLADEKVRQAEDRERTRASEADKHAMRVREVESELGRIERRIDDSAAAVAHQLEALSSGFTEQVAAVEQTMRSMQEMGGQIGQISQHVETLASNAEESSSSILEMTATNDEVVENTGNLASSVRETVSSIEEMTYSIKEVARNVDALSLTAEETSSSMNEMDVSIDQVQSNANETARLSEQVARDAEIGAEAILKTIQEINRIKETSSGGRLGHLEPRHAASRPSATS